MRDDPRVTPARPDLAAAHLRGRVEAARWAEPVRKVVGVPVAPVTGRPEAEAPMTSQLLLGEGFDVYETAAGWCWGQGVLDGYVGHIPAACLDAPGPAPTHRVAVPLALAYPAAAFKAQPLAALPCGARVAVAGAEGPWLRLAAGGFVPARHLAPLDTPAADWVAVAEALLGAPYLWGGRSSSGIDCSGLVQLALQAAGVDCPRDSDQQEAALGATLTPGSRLARGDLVFWKGHVGILTSPGRLLHANIHHMAVASEPLSAARARIRAAGGGRVTRYARVGALPGLDGPADAS